MPEKMMEDSKGHYILGLLLFISGLLVLLVVVTLRSQADDSSTSATINNATPSVDTITISDTSLGSSIGNIDLNENTTKTVYVHGAYSDANGCSDVATSGSLTLRFFLTPSGSTCTQNDTNCYTTGSTGYTCNYSTVPGDSCSGGSDTTANYECSVPLQYFAVPTDNGSPNQFTDWRGLITAVDGSNATGTLYYGVEVNTLRALDVTASINYGSLSVGATSGTDVPSTITNTGNDDDLDVEISGTSMACTAGTIAVGNQKYSLTASEAYGSMIALSGTPVTQQTNIPAATVVATPSTDDVYWKLQVPNGVSGSCSGTTTFSAVAG